MIYSTTTKRLEHRNSPTILRSCTTGFVNGIWNDQKVRWFTVDSVNCVDGILVIWNDESFKVDSIHWAMDIALLGTQECYIHYKTRRDLKIVDRWTVLMNIIPCSGQMDCIDRDIAGGEEPTKAMDDLLAISLRCILPQNERPNIRQVFDDLCSISV
uniref:Uncharacterized protein n=1 Tax=Populus trichocarpa TaxID=3694 RepID=A0A2K1R5A7_POPTR